MSWTLMKLAGVGSLTAMAFAAAPTPANADAPITVDGRTVTVHEPPGYDPGTPAPLVIALHGYTMWGAFMESYTGLTPELDAHGFLYLYPDGLVDCFGDRFWNATPACCEFCGNPVDDVGFVQGLVDEVKTQWNVDPQRVYLVGYSNGGFMAYRMACEHAETFAAIVSLAGATFPDPLDCSPSEPVHTLQIHGTADTTIEYAGGAIAGNPYPGAVESAEIWATYNACSLVPEASAPNLDLVTHLSGAETGVARYASGCPFGGSSELWTVQGGVHFETLSSNFATEVVSFLSAHAKPAPVPSLDWRGAGLLGLLVTGIALTAGFRRAGAGPPTP